MPPSGQRRPRSLLLACQFPALCLHLLLQLAACHLGPFRRGLIGLVRLERPLLAPPPQLRGRRFLPRRTRLGADTLQGGGGGGRMFVKGM